MINAAGWHLRLNISSSLGKDLQLMDAGSEEQIFFFVGYSCNLSVKALMICTLAEICVCIHNACNFSSCVWKRFVYPNDQTLTSCEPISRISWILVVTFSTEEVVSWLCAKLNFLPRLLQG